MIASLLPTAVGLMMLPIYTRYLTPQDYGIVALVLSFQMFLPIILSLKLGSSLSRFYFEHTGSDLKVFISTLLFVIFMLSLTATTIIYINVDSIVSYIFPLTLHKYYELFKIGVIVSFLAIFNNFFINLVRVREKAKLFMKIQLTLFVVNFIINITEVIILERGAYGVIEASMISVIISLLIYTYINKKYLGMTRKFEYLIEPIKFSFFLITK